jgi:outer membrane protein assembly factor BamB
MGYSLFQPTGVTHLDPDKAFPGYTLFATLSGEEAYLIDLKGETVKTWRVPAPYKPYYGYFLESGNLLMRCSSGNETWAFGGASSTVLELDWDGNVVWKYEHATLHHDHCRLRNGNTAVIGWEVLDPYIAARVKGGVPGSEMEPGILDEDFCWVPDLAAKASGNERAAGAMISDALYEIDKTGAIVWEWHGSDHLDPEVDAICPLEGRQEWTHCNAVEEMPDGRLLLSFRQTSTVTIVDKGSGKVDWRFGPGVLSHQHDPTPLSNGNILIFDNGEHRVRGSCHSKVVEVNPDTSAVEWSYTGSPPLAFFSTGISGAQRLPNGNTFICEGRTGRLFEVTGSGEIVWEYINPHEAPHRGDVRNRAVFRSHRYAADGPELRGRV